MRVHFFKRFFLYIITLLLYIPTFLLQNASAQIPSSRRSRKAIERVKPTLKQELARDSLELGAPIFIRIFKASKELEVWVKKKHQFQLFKTYPICTFSGELGPKLKQGDLQAPEGFYYVPPGQLNPNSTFHLSFNIGYPNAYDRYHKRTGSAIMVHGSCVSIGCFAMTNKYIEEIFTLAVAAFEKGQPFFRVHIFPFRMTEENMQLYPDSEWYSFWENLKEGYDYFEKKGMPPNTVVRRGQYVFRDGS